MRRRDFIKLASMSCAGVMIGANIARSEAAKEISRNLFNTSDEYDVVICGGGISGFFAALHAAKRGLKTLVLERRTYLGSEISATRRLWLDADGFDPLKASFGEIFFPLEEKKSVYRKLGSENAATDKEILLYAGSIKKGLLRTLIKNGVDIMFMTDACGVFADDKNKVSGVLLASKQGLFAVKTKAIIDADKDNILTRSLFSPNDKPSSASFVMELDAADVSKVRKIRLPENLETLDDSLCLHCGKRFAEQAFAEFSFAPTSANISDIEIQARKTALKISKYFPNLSGLTKAKVRWLAEECALNYATPAATPTIKNFILLNAPSLINSCAEILERAKIADEPFAKIEASKSGKPSKLFLSSGVIVIDEDFEKPICECGKPLPLRPFEAHMLKLVPQTSKVLVCGGGTAGMQAAQASCQNGASATLLEYFNSLGGTKTMGGVMGYYWGITTSPRHKELAEQTRKFAKKYNLTLLTAKSLMHEIAIIESGGKIETGAIICEAVAVRRKKSRALKYVVASQRGSINAYSAQITIDATADADVAHFADVKSRLGDARLGITQNYSQWPLQYVSKIKDKKGIGHSVTKDLDLLDSTSVLEFQRGIMISHYEAEFYDFHPQLTVRESRRPQTEHTLTLPEILCSQPFPDTIAQAHSDFDPHHFSYSEISRTSLMLPHWARKNFANIPFSCLLPIGLDGLILSGRGIGVSHLALQFTRMSADVEALGKATGEIAAECCKSKIQPRDFDASKIRQRLISSNDLSSEFFDCKYPTADEIADELAKGNRETLLDACLEEREKILPKLVEVFAKNPSLNLARALCWFGDSRGAKTVAENLQKNIDAQKASPHPSDYYETYARGDLSSLYWQINSDIAFLALSNSDEGSESILKLADTATSGGNIVYSSKPYYANRIDVCLVPNFNLLVNIAFYAERRPSQKFVAPLEKLLQDPMLKDRLTMDAKEARQNVYHANLSLILGAAAARCGSVAGAKELVKYLKDEHIFFRRFANSELAAVYKMDNEFDANRWSKILKIPPNITPLKQKFEI